MRILFAGTAHPFAVAKSMKRSLAKHGIPVGIRTCEETVAKMFGYANAHEMRAVCSESTTASLRDGDLSAGDAAARNAQYVAAVSGNLRVDPAIAMAVVDELCPTRGASVARDLPCESPSVAQPYSNLLRDWRDARHNGYVAGQAGDKKLSEQWARVMDDLQEQAVRAFAKLNGWKFTGYGRFNLRALAHDFETMSHRPAAFLRRIELSGIEDHSLSFIGHLPGQEGRKQKVAVVGQPYGTMKSFEQTIEDWARPDPKRRTHLVCHVPPAGPYASIWLPGGTLFFVFTPPGVDVKWLPEQMTPTPLYQRGPHS